MSSSSSFAIPINGRKLSKRKRLLEETDNDANMVEDGPDDQPTSRDASGKPLIIVDALTFFVSLSFKWAFLH